MVNNQNKLTLIRLNYKYTVFQNKWHQTSNHYNYGISYQN